MGGGATKLYSALAHTLSSSGGSSRRVPLPLTHLDPYQPADTILDPDFCQEEQKGSSLSPLDPAQVLQQCEEALSDRPARFRRTFIRPSNGNGDTIRVMQWNILAQALGEGLDSFVLCPPEALTWLRRKYLILDEILTYRPHILCMQEVDHYFDTLQPVLARLGYSSRFCPKPWSPCLDVEGNNGPDGCALFFDESRFEFLECVSLQLSAMMIPTNQVALVMMLRCRSTGRCVCVAVTHLKARSGWEWLRSAQGSDLLRQVQNVVQKHAVRISAGSGSQIPLIICGDFNAVPNEEVYCRFVTSPLGLDSAYKKLSKDCSSEPRYTTWKIRPTGECCTTLDYIWYTTDTLKVAAVLDMPSEKEIGPNRLPSFSYPSDHLSLVCDFSFKEHE
ncbi:nocturnin isoform X2 [Syngnathoides biaculeatus]|nr:nocturnin isoform X2 [Syngnathoides biaculeatus]XP_061685927.1 nocturnin isoform X2 [Syngnathoides biaculeatus]XP_061685928.1 nocturnin isoform X2 [Syngnathoides biaculeatus]XP_061685929.1 nocturnin isoform X2 [Syngnathoides biaculeatus]XP_061685930.1 nocturnin isoform X2 [Syngnathoides biaculeatus]